MTWVLLNRRSDLPKLRWLIHALKRAGVRSRINGASFHAPILQVQDQDIDVANLVLEPVEDLEEDDPMFDNTEWARAWWINPPRADKVRELAAALGLLASQIRRQVAGNARCVPEGEDPRRCPVADKKIQACPAQLWSMCRPMVRVETHLLAVAQVMSKNTDDEDDLAIGRAAGLFQALEVGARDGGHPHGDYLFAFCHVLGLRMSEGRLGRIVKLSKRKSGEIVQDVMRETVVVEGKLLPRRAEIVGVDVIARDAEDWQNN